MALKLATRSAQWPLVSEFIFSFDDTMLDINGVSKTFGAGGTAVNGVFDIIKLPPGAEVLGGQVVVELQSVGPSPYTAKLGVAGNDAIYLAAATCDLLGAVNARYPILTTTTLGSNTGLNVRMTMVNTGAAATAGKWRVSVFWKLDGKANEVYPI